MSLSTETTTKGESARPAPASPAAAGGSLLTGAAGESCTVCNARLAIDQRYCVECGTRRGDPRFTLAQPVSQAAAAAGSGGGRSAPAAAISRMQLLVALLVILVAIGVGVLIGHGTARTPQVNVTGGGVSSPQGTHGSNSGSSAQGSGSSAQGSGSGSSATPFTNGG